MIRKTDINIAPQDVIDLEERLRRKFPDMSTYRVEKRSLDARHRLVYRYQISVYSGDDHPPAIELPSIEQGDETIPDRPIIIGAGPGGLFCALALAEAGYAPLLVDRGQDIPQRVRDVEASWRDGSIDPESNMCFGAGGAGTFSDGKVYTRSSSPLVRFVAQVFHDCGAADNVLYDKTPHIGSDRLRAVMPRLMNRIREAGGELRFGWRLDAIESGEGRVQSLDFTTPDGARSLEGPVILAAGQHCDDLYYLLERAGARLLYKDMAVGFRLELSQRDVDASVYRDPKAKGLPPGEFRLACHLKDDNRGVYTFCMCPGGEVVQASPLGDRHVLNGMSNSRRDGGRANAGLVVTIRDLTDDPLGNWGAGLRWRREIEERCREMTGSARCPAQTVAAYLGKGTPKARGTSYRSGFEERDLTTLYPDYVGDSIRRSAGYYRNRLKGFERGLLLAPETRTSSPVRIERGDDMVSTTLDWLYPVGEGAGYAGGIMSAAVDGIRAAQAIIQRFGRGL